jgi:DNA-binding MarR family transcriptional regulator
MERLTSPSVTVSSAHKCAWGAMLMTQATLNRDLNARLESAGHVSLELYDVLLALEESPDGRQRMSDLAQMVIFSPSGLTRVIDRLQKAGLVRRERCESDRRSTYAVITPRGRTERKSAWPTYERGLREVWAAFISDEQATQVFNILRQVLGKFERGGCADLLDDPL